MLSIILPTLNEAGNIGVLIEKIYENLEPLGIEYEMIVVDANSPDGTADIAKKKQKEGKPVRVELTKVKGDLSKDTYYGFSFAKYELISVMDTDMQHDPVFLPDLLKVMIDEPEIDMVIGSRYVEGGGLGDWPMYRKIISKIMVKITKFLTGVSDPLTQYYIIRKEIIDSVKLDPKGLRLSLYLIANPKVKKIKEVPIIFRKRGEGESTQTLKRILTDLGVILKLVPPRIKRMFNSSK